jgi:hypothetical protein
MQERDKIRSRRIFGLILVTFLILGVGSWVSTVLLHRDLATWPHEPHPSPSAAPRTIGSIEQTEIETTAVGQVTREKQRESLEHNAIPIDRAMDLVVEQKEIR